MWRVENGDCVEIMAAMDEASVDAICTDPPYGLEFMGRAWDRFDGGGIDPAFGHWLAGFIDGEGCFHIHRKPQGTFDCQFSISLRGDDMPILERCHRMTGLGTLALTKTAGNPKARWTVSSKAACLALRDLLRAFPLRAKKAHDFELWSEAVTEWVNHERGEWDSMEEIRAVLMDSRAYVDGGVRVDPFQMWCWRWAREALRVLKPGGHLLAFGGTRTYHRLACAVEDAGFEIRDTIAWLYGSGFPKSLDVSKAIDRTAGAERPIVDTIPDRWAGKGQVLQRATQDERSEAHITAPATPDAERWQGWGTALKPAHEPIVVARKPLVGTVAQNVLTHGTGALNVDGCRVGTGDGGNREGEASAERRYNDNGSTNFAPTPGPRGGDAAGRWPANVVLDEQAAAMLDEQTGELTSGRLQTHHKRSGASQIGTFEIRERTGEACDWGGDSGGGSRFFYCAKATSYERSAGLGDDAGLFATGEEPDRNDHPTVKPISLMRWLVRLVTPPRGVILDPFAGSGTTGCAAVLEGFDFIGIEREAAYVAICKARVAYWATGQAAAA
jgi:site-specific DNA-methyltransferase (adenine-specific)